MSKSRHLVELYKHLNFRDKETAERHYQVLHTVFPEAINIRKDHTIEDRYFGSAEYIRLGLLLRKLIPYTVLNLTLSNLLNSFYLLFINENEGGVVDRGDIKEMKAFISKDISIRFIKRAYERSYSRYRESLEKKRRILYKYASKN